MSKAYSDEEIEKIMDLDRKGRAIIEALTTLKERWVLVVIAFLLIAIGVILLGYAMEREQ